MNVIDRYILCMKWNNWVTRNEYAIKMSKNKTFISNIRELIADGRRLLFTVSVMLIPLLSFGQWGAVTIPFGTGATPAATYWTFNASYKSANVTLSSGNLVTTFTSGTQAMAIATLPGSTTGKSTGQWFWQLTITTGGGAWSAGVISGLSPSTYNGHLGADANGYAYYSTSGGWWAAGSLAFNSCGTTYWSVTTNVIGFALDAGANTIAIYLNNVLQCTKSISGGNYFPATSSVSSNVGTWNFGATAFTYPPPPGYVALN